MDSCHIVHLCLCSDGALLHVARHRCRLNHGGCAACWVVEDLLTRLVCDSSSVDAAGLWNEILGITHQLDVVDNLGALLVVEPLQV